MREGEPAPSLSRSENMRRVKAKNTQPEIRVRKALHRMGFRFRLHRKDLPGTPDVYLPKFKLAVFVHGCFWHGHAGCKKATIPKTRTEFWQNKIERTKVRDVNVREELTSMGVSVVVVWECELLNEKKFLRRVEDTIERLNG